MGKDTETPSIISTQFFCNSAADIVCSAGGKVRIGKTVLNVTFFNQAPFSKGIEGWIIFNQRVMLKWLDYYMKYCLKK